jgi:hypothetical protein
MRPWQILLTNVVIDEATENVFWEPLYLREYFHFPYFTVTPHYIHVKVLWIRMPCSVAGYQRFKGPCLLHLQGEVTGDGKKWHIYRPGVQEDGRCHLANRKWEGSGLVASATSMKREHLS